MLREVYFSIFRSVKLLVSADLLCMCVWKEQEYKCAVPAKPSTFWSKMNGKISVNTYNFYKFASFFEDDDVDKIETKKKEKNLL